MQTFYDYGIKTWQRIDAMLKLDGLAFPSSYEKFLQLDEQLRRFIGNHIPIVLSDNYEHFMACLPRKDFAGQHVLIRKQIGGFTVACGFWKWLEFLSQPLTKERVELITDFFSGKHNNHPRQFDKKYWMHVVDDYGGYMPIRIEYPGEGAVFTGVPFPVAQVYGETPAVWVNEPMYIQIGHLSHVATVAAQFAEVLGDPWRFIEVMFRALHNKEESSDVILAMLIGGGIISTSNDLGAFINGAPFKSAGTTGHCWYQQYETLKEALRTLLKSPLGKYSTVLLDVFSHEHGFKELMDLILNENLEPPFAERPDSGNVTKMGMHDMTVLADHDKNVNIVIEDGKRPDDVLAAEKIRRQYGLAQERMLFGGGSAFLGRRSDLEPAYKACHFHNGTPDNPIDIIETMKICLDDKMKQSIPGMIDWMFDLDTSMYMIAPKGAERSNGYSRVGEVLYDGLSNPGQPYFHPGYSPQRLVTSPAIIQGQERSAVTRWGLGPSFTLDIGENRAGVAMSSDLRAKRRAIYERALQIIKAE